MRDGAKRQACERVRWGTRGTLVRAKMEAPFPPISPRPHDRAGARPQKVDTEQAGPNPTGPNRLGAVR